jgi:hypothetical protein
MGALSDFARIFWGGHGMGGERGFRRWRGADGTD